MSAFRRKSSKADVSVNSGAVQSEMRGRCADLSQRAGYTSFPALHKELIRDIDEKISRAEKAAAQAARAEAGRVAEVAADLVKNRPASVCEANRQAHVLHDASYKALLRAEKNPDFQQVTRSVKAANLISSALPSYNPASLAPLERGDFAALQDAAEDFDTRANLTARDGQSLGPAQEVDNKPVHTITVSRSPS